MRDAVQQTSAQQISHRRGSEHHRPASHAQRGPPLLHGATSRQDGWATHPRIGLPDHAGALREDRAGSWGLLAVCHPPACRALPPPCAMHGHSLGGHGRGCLWRCGGLGRPRWSPLLNGPGRLLGSGRRRSARRDCSGRGLLGGRDCWSAGPHHGRRSLSGGAASLEAEGAHRRSRPLLVAGWCLHGPCCQAGGGHHSVS